MTVKSRYEQLAATWVTAERRSEALLLDCWGVLALSCWVSSAGALAEGVSPDLKEFHKASRETLDGVQPRWLDELVSVRSYCDGCGERYRVENLSICTDCRHAYCYRCTSDFTRAPNGNPAHHCGGEIVG